MLDEASDRGRLDEYKSTTDKQLRNEQGKAGMPLAGAHASVEVEAFGLFKRNHKTILTIEAANGSQIVETFGARFGTKGGVSRTIESRIRKAAAAINTTAAQAVEEK